MSTGQREGTVRCIVAMPTTVQKSNLRGPSRSNFCEILGNPQKSMEASRACKGMNRVVRPFQKRLGGYLQIFLNILVSKTLFFSKVLGGLGGFRKVWGAEKKNFH